MSKKVIAIYVDNINGEIKQTFPYIQFIMNFGIPRFVNVYDNPEVIANECDALLVPGGADVNPMRYGEIPDPATGRCNIQYEYLDSVMIPAFVKVTKPIIGICRGFQSLNVHFGGTLFQDIKGHNQLTFMTKNRASAKDDLIADGKIYKINSIHHQAIKQLGSGLSPIGFSPVIQNCKSLNNTEFLTVKKYKKKDVWNFTEAFKHDKLPVVAFQYHPEEFNCPFAIQEINKILN